MNIYWFVFVYTNIVTGYTKLNVHVWFKEINRIFDSAIKLCSRWVLSHSLFANVRTEAQNTRGVAAKIFDRQQVLIDVC